MKSTIFKSILRILLFLSLIFLFAHLYFSVEGPFPGFQYGAKPLWSKYQYFLYNWHTSFYTLVHIFYGYMGWSISIGNDTCSYDTIKEAVNLYRKYQVHGSYNEGWHHIIDTNKTQIITKITRSVSFQAFIAKSDKLKGDYLVFTLDHNICWTEFERFYNMYYRCA